MYTSSVSNHSAITVSQDAVTHPAEEVTAVDANKSICQIKEQPDENQQDLSIPVEDTSAWLHVFAAFLVFFMTWGPSTGIGASASFYRDSLLVGHSSSEIAWIGGVQTFLLVAGGAVSGPLFDQGYFRVMVSVGLSCCILAFMLLGLCTQYYQVFLTQGVMFGLGSGLAYVPCLAMVSVRFETHRAIAVGLVTSGSSVGGIVFPILIRTLQPQLGFPWTTRLIGFLMLLTSFVVLLIIFRNSPSKTPPRKLFQLSALTEPPFALFSLAYTLQILAFWIPLAFVPTYAIDRLHVSESLAYSLLAVVNGASFFGRILPCLIAQRTGPFNVLMVATVACAVILFVWIACVDLSAFIAFCVLWGFFSGVIPSVVPLCVVVKPLSPGMDVAGTRLGMAWLACSFGTLVGNPIAGALITTRENGTVEYLRLQVFAGVIMAAALAFYVWPWLCFEKVRRQGRKEGKRVRKLM